MAVDAKRGRAEVLGFNTPSQADKVRQKTGALLEHMGLYERLRAEDKLDFFGRIWRLSKTERQTRIREFITRLGLVGRTFGAVGVTLSLIFGLSFLDDYLAYPAVFLMGVLVGLGSVLVVYNLRVSTRI